MRRWRSVFCLLLLTGIAAGEEKAYVPDRDVEQLIQQTFQADKGQAQKAVERLAKNPKALSALNWHLFSETTNDARRRWAELIAKMGLGRPGYRVTLELQPDGSGNLTLWSDRAALAQCQRKFDR